MYSMIESWSIYEKLLEENNVPNLRHGGCFGTDFTLPRWLRDVPTEQVEIGKSGVERETDELCMSRRKNNSIDENFRKEPDYE